MTQDGSELDERRPANRLKPVTLVADISRRHTFVSMRDIAANTVAALAHPAARHTMLLIGGDAR